MITLYTIHGHNNAKVESVMAEMAVLGAPSIRVVDCGDHYRAIEGVHRIEAACRLGIVPNLILLDQNEMVEADSLDWEDGLGSGESYTAGELAGEVAHPENGIYNIDDDGALTLICNGRFIPSF